MPNPSDEQLIAEYLQGNERSLETLIQSYLKPIYGFVYRYVGQARDAEDITQEVFVKVWRHLKRFDRERSFKTWLFAIAKNAALDFLKKSRAASGGKKSIPFSAFDKDEDGGEEALAETLVDPAPLAPELFERQDLAQTLTRAMENLSSKYREVLFLHYNDHFTFREIAEMFGEPLDTIKSRHRRALIILKRLIETLS